MSPKTMSRAASACAALALICGEGFAQEPKPAAPQQRPAAGAPTAGPSTSLWNKICDPKNKDHCVTTRDVFADTGQRVASLALQEAGGKKLFAVMLPPGLLLRPGIQILVDQNPPIKTSFSICQPDACAADVAVDEPLLKAMQKGTTMVIQALNNQNKNFTVPVSLAGFSKALEGPGQDPETFVSERQGLNDGLVRKAQETRDKLPPAGGAAPAAAGKPPAKAP